MNDVAQAAGIARATLHRYLASRDVMLQAVASTVFDATATRLADAELDKVPVAEGLARVARIIASAGSKYSALLSQLLSLGYSGDTQEEMKRLLEALMLRGITDGTLRDDLTAEELVSVFGSLLETAARLATEDVTREQAAALVTSTFLRGAERRP